LHFDKKISVLSDSTWTQKSIENLPFFLKNPFDQPFWEFYQLVMPKWR
jgi:hypothetical protein